MAPIHFETQLFEINAWTILRLPESASAELPSRGMTMVSGTINGAPFKALLEPDGRYAPGKGSSHWFSPDKKLLDDASSKAGDTVQVSLEPSKEWIEPEVPDDFKEALVTSPKAEDLWNDIQLAAETKNAHYMGSVVLQSTNGKEFSVIDGQQRFTTLTILTLAIIDAIQKLVDNGIEVSENKE